MMLMGSLNTYTKQLKLQTQFHLKQAKGELGAHKTLEQYLGEAAEDAGEKNGSDDTLRSIHQKLDAGAKLTAQERRYLQSKDPEAYAKLEASEREQKAFEQKLRQCRTKEEAQRLKMTYLNTSLVVVKAVENNSNISQAKKLEIMTQEKRRCDKLEQSAREFVRRGDYERLPTEAEQAKAEKEAQKAQRPAEQKEPETPDVREAQEDQEKEAVHVESREERKVKRARAQARARAQKSAAADFTLAAAAYRSSAKAAPAPQPTVDVKG